MLQVNNERAIRTIVSTCVEAYASGFSDRHISELNDEKGTINLKINNVFIAALGPEIQYYSAMARSLDSSLGNMIEKQSNEGSMTIKIDVTMVKEFIPNYDPNIKGESREISKPQFKHKVTSAVKITDEKGGNLNNEMEMVMDEETGCYVLQPIANTQQRTIFDSDFMQGQKQEGEGNEDIIDGTYIDADVRPALPGPADEEKPAETEETDTQPTEEETQSEENGEEPGDTPAEEPNEEEPEDITDDILGDADTEGYDYEDPEE